ncbi:hypothetical protein [Bacillus toyonensis]|uniref:hypothetical protein n=1 Tax=Bacillus toyonensis TaxID=155322 RepID=UPI000BF4D0EB|nr:hypothetical protein [Bacillus toyonensis]PEU35518.1 hypothetical protein CN537_25180 [Bacillus toyonensis]
MKLTLFTISNEQIKEQLSKLQTKVESLETVKEVQDKIISAKDSQISFLNDSIANIWASVSIAATFIIFVFGYVAWLNKQAQNKVEQAESLIRQNQQTANIAQGKLDQLEEKQKHLQKQADALDYKIKLDIKFNSIKTDLLFLYKQQEKDIHICKNEQIEEFNKFTTKTNELEAEYILLFSDLTSKIIMDVPITDENIQQLERLTVDAQEFTNDYISFRLNVKLLNGES